jgi:hypothetical protein
MRLRLPWAIATASVAGCLTICALVPWGDPCTAKGYAGHACPIIFSDSQTLLRNVILVAICVLIGFAAAALTRSRWYIAGGLSTPLAVLSGGITAHFAYAVETPLFRASAVANYWLSVGALACLGLLGMLGAALWRWLPNLRSSERAEHLR